MAYSDMQENLEDIVTFIKELYPFKKQVHLHEPKFIGNERRYVLDAIDSTFVSSIGPYVDKFGDMIKDYTGAKYAVPVVNGTSALYLALLLAGVKDGDLVITQAFTFVATANAIQYARAMPIFIDIDNDTLGMSPESLESFLKHNVKIVGGEAVHVASGKRISACVPMHSFGIPCRIDKIVEICATYGIKVVEDSAESLGSTYSSMHTGRFGLVGIYSFNGNKTITCGGGGILITDDSELGKLAKHLSTQAKTPHPWEFSHDLLGFNFRCPNLNAALACAQLEQIESFISVKRKVAESYQSYFADKGMRIITELPNSRANYWLNSVIMKSTEERNKFLTLAHAQDVYARPAWNLMSDLPMYASCLNDGLVNSINIQSKLVSLPSGVNIE